MAIPSAKSSSEACSSRLGRSPRVCAPLGRSPAVAPSTGPHDDSEDEEEEEEGEEGDGTRCTTAISACCA